MSSKLDSPSASADRAAGPRLRLWPLAIIAGGTAIALVLIWRADLTRSWAVVYTGQTIGISLLAFLGWLLFFSGMRTRTRLISFLAVVAPLAIAIILLKVDHVSGDLVPALRWRFAPKPYQRLSAPTDVSAGGTAQGIDLAAGSEYDWPQFLGPRGDGMLPEVRLASDWEKHPPRQLWRQPIGAGWSSFAVVGNYCLTQEQRGPQEMVTCYELKTGKLIWAHSDETLYESKIAGDGPRATPTVDHGQVFTTGARGLLNGLDGRTGRPLWPARDVLRDTSPALSPWGKACSPLVVDNLVVVTGGADPGPSLVAYDRYNGELAWKADDEQKGNQAYCSPMLAELCGQRQILILNDNTASGFDLGGKLLWSHPWPGDESKATQPLALTSDRVLIASGYGVGSALLQLSRSEDGTFVVAELWRNRKLKPKFSNLVHRDGFVYGLDEGILVCLEIDSGEQRWKKGRYGHGQILLIGELILVQAEQGDVALVEASPEAYREVARIPALSDKTWNHPVFVPPYLLVRNDQEAACYELTLEAPAAASAAGE